MIDYKYNFSFRSTVQGQQLTIWMAAHKLSNQVCSSIIFHPRSTMAKLHQMMFFTPNGQNGQDVVKSVDRFEEDGASTTNDVEKQY